MLEDVIYADDKPGQPSDVGDTDSHESDIAPEAASVSETGTKEATIPGGQSQATGETESAEKKKPSDKPAADGKSHGESKSPQTPDEMRDLVAGGMELLGTLANVLKKPDSAKALADVLVTENPDTGEASLNIPVPDKATVVNILSAFSALLKR